MDELNPERIPNRLWTLPLALFAFGSLVTALLWLGSVHLADAERQARFERDAGPVRKATSERLSRIIDELNRAAPGLSVNPLPSADTFEDSFDSAVREAPLPGLHAVIFIEHLPSLKDGPDTTQNLIERDEDNVDYGELTQGNVRASHQTQALALVTRLASRAGRSSAPLQAVELRVGAAQTRSSLIATDQPSADASLGGSNARVFAVLQLSSALERQAQTERYAPRGQAPVVLVRGVHRVDGSLVGWLGAAIDVEDLLAGAGLAPDELQLRLSVTPNGARETALLDTIGAHQAVVSGTLAIPSSASRVNFAAAPRQAYPRSDQPWFVLVIGTAVMCCCVAAALARGALARRLTVVQSNLETEAHAARHDGLTGLANRSTFMARLSEELADPERRAGLAVVFFDLDRFKLVNDSLGHDVGDDLLRAVAERLGAGPWATSGLLARLSGDEFAALWRPLSAESARRDLTDLVRSFAEPLELPSGQLAAGISAGLAIATALGQDSSELLQRADRAMYSAKRQGGLQVVVHDESQREIAERGNLEAAMRLALARGVVALHAQAVIDAKGEQLGLVLSLAWDSPIGALSGHGLTGLAEEVGLGAELADRLCRDSCRFAAMWQRRDAFTARPGARPQSPEPFIRLDLAERQLLDPGLASSLTRWLRVTGAAAQSLVIGIPEALLVRNPPGLHSAANELRAVGVRLAVVDFGAAAAPLVPLAILQVSQVVLSGRLVAAVFSAQEAHVLAAVVAWSRSAGAVTVLDGVEDLAAVDALAELGVNGFSGAVAGPARAAARGWQADGLGLRRG